MKKTSKTPTPQLPVSQKAYAGFRQRIIDVNTAFGLDPSHMLKMLDEYLGGVRNPDCGGGQACSFAFRMLRDDIDLAIARSARARENARRRRERKERQMSQPEHNGQPDTTPAKPKAVTADRRPDSTAATAGNTADDERKARNAAAFAEALKTCIRAQLYPDEYRAATQQHSPTDAYDRKPCEVLSRYSSNHYPSSNPYGLTGLYDNTNDSPYQY